MAANSSHTLLVTADKESSIHGNIGQGLDRILGGDVSCAQFEDIELLISDVGVELFCEGTELGEYDRIVMYGGVTRSLRITHPLAVALVARGLNAYTSGAENFRGLDKLSQNVLFSVNKIPIPRTYFAKPELLIKNAESKIGFPLILKDILASRGERNYLIQNQKELESHIDELKEDRYIIQQFIKNDGDLRILINSSGDYFAFKRTAAVNTHLNNTSAGGHAEIVESVSGAVIDACKKIIHEMNMPLLGIDVIVDGDSFWVLEANTQPQIFTGAFIPEKKRLFSNVTGRL